jgi:ATP-dependent DNA helicase RecG
MDDHELERLLADMESDRVERKSSLSDGEKVRQSLCALANDLPDHRQPGVLFIGIEDRGACAGLPINDALLKKLSDIRSDGAILPLPTLTVQKRTLAGCEVAVVTVEPAEAPPVRYRGRVYVRVGPTTRAASPEEERRLAERRRARDLPFDLRPLGSANVEDLDLDLFVRIYLPSALSPEVLEENQRSVVQQLASLRFATPQEPQVPTVLGLLVAGVDPRRFVPGAYVQFLRIDGTELTDPIRDQKEIGGALPDLLRRLDEVLEAHVFVSSDPGARIDPRQPDYPIAALQQLARNAVLHRDYEGTHAPVRVTWYNDRIDIQSPGGPFGQVTRANFGQPGITDYRNPDLAEAMKNLGYVQRFGVGIPIARRELERNGNPPLEFRVEDAYVQATLRKGSG